MKGVNKAIVVGRVGKDPEVINTKNGNQIVNLSIATDESYKDKSTGQQVKQTEWHKVVFFSRLAEIVAQYVTKGSSLYVEGRLRTRKWQDQGGNDRYTTEIVGNEMQMLDSSNSQQSKQPQQNYQQPQQPQQNYQQPQQPQQNYQQPQQPQQNYQQPQADDFQDDIPF